MKTIKNIKSLLKNRTLILFTHFLLLSSLITAQDFTEIRIAQISTGVDHTLAIDTLGNLWAWGNNLHGQVGYSVYENYYATPVQFDTSTKYKGISAGYRHSIAIDISGKLFQWGYHCFDDGVNLSWESVYEPEALSPELEFEKISAGLYFNLALDKNGKLYTWGDNTYGQLGIGNDIIAKSVPTPILSENTFVEISAGSYHAMAIDENGGLWVWGRNENGQLGNGGTTDEFIPQKLSTSSTFKKLSAGLNHSLVLDITGVVYSCGNNEFGQLGIIGGESSMVLLALDEMDPAISFSDVFSGWNCSFALSTNGEMFSWGVNSYGQLGCNDQVDKSLPTPILTDMNSLMLSSKTFHALAIDTNGYLYAWGLNDNSQLGITNLEYSLSPKLVNNGKNLNITAGGLSTSISKSEMLFISSLTLTGTIDARDFAFMRDSMPELSVLDISTTSIEFYTGEGGTADGNYLYMANEIPIYCFYNATTQSSKLSITEVYFPVGITSINDMSFYYCAGLKRVVFADPSHLISIHFYAFAGCSSLDGVVLPESLNYLGDGALYYTNHSIFFVPAGVTYIGNQALAMVKSHINVNPSNPNYMSNDGVLYSKDQKKLLQCPSEKEGEFIMPNTVESVERAAFIFCRFLTSIVNSSNLINIEDYAFYSCNSLTSYDIPDNIKAIKPYTFAGCHSLNSISIPGTVLSIGNSAFFGCINLNSISIPNSITTIESNAFNYCTGLTSFYANPISPVNLSASTNVFQYVDRANCLLYVPSGSKNDYQNAHGWKDFVFIEEMEPTSSLDMNENEIIITVQNKQIRIQGVCPGEKLSVYNIMGALIFKQIAVSEYEEIGIETSGVYLVKIGDKSTKVIVN
ncbi:MAG: leucine-rich repeat protein [Bacteroidales bacterium]|nr:leucine-rich repeat protein [Bacteroidales bacterium]MCF8390027.1 leucine-rich repeat protein [Bacteroidales bacterium]